MAMREKFVRDLSLYAPAPYACSACGGINHFQGDFYGYADRVILTYVCPLGHTMGLYSTPEIDPYHEYHYRRLYDPFYAMFGPVEEVL